MTAKTLNTLSTNDLAILGAIFDPETSLSRSSKDRTLTSTTQSNNTKATTLPEVLSAEKSILKTLNTPNPSPETLTAAITQLSTLITTNPTHSSLYTNRAQATRLLPSSLTTPHLLHSILLDLNTAITLTPPTTSHSPSTLITAHTHRAYILLSLSQNPSQFTTLTSLNDNIATLGLSSPGKGPVTLSPSHLEDLASRDFSVAAALGDEDARKMSVKTNPYAKMCGAIVREALREEIRGFYEGRAC